MPPAFEKFDKDEELKRRLHGLPRLWFNPLRRYSRSQSISSDGMDGAFVARTQDGRVERVRYATQADTKALLLAEYDALLKASHEYLVKLCWAGLREQRLYVATSWIDVKKREDWPIPIRTLLGQMECAARGVAALHAKGLVHGDLKPETILWDGDRAVVADLKLAAPAGRRGHGSYSPKFAAPEQILAETVGPEADVYAVGVTLYTRFIRERFPTLLKTEEQAGGHGNTEVLSSVTSLPAASEAASDRGEGRIVGAKVVFRSRLSRVVEGSADANLISSVLTIVQRACELDPKKRYPDAGALADALREVRARA